MHATRSAGAMARWARTGCVLRPGSSAVSSPSPCGRPVRRVAAAASALTYPPPIVSRPTAPHTATCILLHGLGDSGNGWAAIADEFKSDLPHVRFVFPNAPMRPITLNWGMQMPGWYDIKSLEDINQVEDNDGLFESKRYVEELVKAEAEAGVPSNRVVVAGFSQGGATALMMLRSELKLAGIVGMSSYLPLRNLEFQVSGANSSTPVLLCHGDSDMTVAYHYGRESRDKLRELGVDVEFITYTGMAHSACSEELQDVLQFLKTHLNE